MEAELSKGDEAKLKDLVSELSALQTKYSFKAAKNKTTYTEVCGLLNDAIAAVGNYNEMEG